MKNSKHYFKKRYMLLLCAIFCTTIVSINAKTHSSTQPHAGSITATAISSVVGKEALFTVGDDGFVIRWTPNGKGEHFQISDYTIKMIAVHPNGNDIAIYETDGFSINRISVWNWPTQTQRFARRVVNTVSSLSYTARGNQLMIGTTSMNGIVFMNSTQGSVLPNKVRDSVGIVSFSQSSSNENTSIMYSSLGYLIYTNLQDGQRKASYRIEANLQDPVLFNNKVLFAGVKSDTIYLYEAITGTIVAEIPANNPILCTSAADNNLYYFETDGKNSVLKMIEVQNGYIKPTPIIIKNFTFKNWENPTSIVKYQDSVYIGMESGELYSVQTNPEVETLTATKISEYIYDQVYDIAEQDGAFYFLTNDAVFKSSYQDGNLDLLLQNTGYMNMIPYEESIILWSKNSRQPVILSSTIDGSQKTLFTPTLPLQMLRVQKNKILYIESSSKVLIYDIETATISTLYIGTGIQDALLYSEDIAYIAKTAASNPQSALVEVNITTKETSAITVQSDIAFSLSENQTGTGPFYGVSLIADSNQSRTEIFSFAPNTKRYTAIFTWKDEDPNAFTYLKNGVLFTNVGKAQIYAYTINQRRNILMQRTASLPIKISATSTMLLVLNKDGSISWYNAQTKKLLKSWYITINGNWVEY